MIDSIKNEHPSKKRKISADLKVQCYYCCKITVKKWVGSHINRMHGRDLPKLYGPPRSYQCPNCKAALEKSPIDQKHICQPVPQLMKREVVLDLNYEPKARGTGEKFLYYCDLCPKIYKRECELKYHKERVHLKTSRGLLLF